MSDVTENSGLKSPIRMTANISAIVTAFDRREMTLKTIDIIRNCIPPPEEILVHFDQGTGFPLPDGVRGFQSAENLGPGGARNRLIRAAKHEWIASFDDDSYPMDSDFFDKLSQHISRHTEAGVLACTIYHKNSEHDVFSRAEDWEVASFVGCGCVYRKSAFLRTSGYLPLPVAYGMEEVDVSLQMRDLGLHVIECPQLRVFHDTQLTHHQSAPITSGAVKNQALLVWLRYPLLAFPLGVLQWLNKIKDSVMRRRLVGAARGVLETPFHIWRYRRQRCPVSMATLKKFRRLSRR